MAAYRDHAQTQSHLEAAREPRARKPLQIFAFAAVLVGLADSLDVLDKTLLAGSVPGITLTLISSVALYLLYERSHEHGELRSLVQQLGLKGKAEVRVMKGSQAKAEYFSRLALSVGQAANSVDDLTWGVVSESSWSQHEKEAFARYLAALQRNRQIKIREVFTFATKSRIERFSRLRGRKSTKHQVRYFDVDHAPLPPLMQFTIIDRREMLVGTYRGGVKTAEEETYLLIRNEDIVSVFASYFDTIWSAAEKAPRRPVEVIADALEASPAG